MPEMGVVPQGWTASELVAAASTEAAVEYKYRRRQEDTSKDARKESPTRRNVWLGPV